MPAHLLAVHPDLWSSHGLSPFSLSWDLRDYFSELTEIDGSDIPNNLDWLFLSMFQTFVSLIFPQENSSIKKRGTGIRAKKGGL